MTIAEAARIMGWSRHRLRDVTSRYGIDIAGLTLDDLIMINAATKRDAEDRWVEALAAHRQVRARIKNAKSKQRWAKEKAARQADLEARIEGLRR